MNVLLRVIAFVIGAGIAYVGGLLWMISNDGVASEGPTKLAGGAAILIGIALIAAAVWPRSDRSVPPDVDLRD